MDTIPLWLPLVFFLIALLYATVGFGGGSSYLAVLAVVGLPYQTIPQAALVCNIIVAGGGSWHFYKGGHLAWKRILPFVTLSIPMAYVGGRVPIDKTLFMFLLGFSLLAAGARTLIAGPRGGRIRTLSNRRSWIIGLPVGAGLGMLAGLVGIGGGIFLAPLLLLAGWADAKQTAAAASLFILLNSLSGLAGQLTKGVFLDAMIVPLAAAVFLGGQIGSRAGSYRLPVAGVRRLLGVLIIAVSLRLLWSAV